MPEPFDFELSTGKPTLVALERALAEPAELTALGFSGRKAEYVVGIARSDLDLAGQAALPDDEVKNTLTALPGIGE